LGPDSLSREFEIVRAVVSYSLSTNNERAVNAGGVQVEIMFRRSIVLALVASASAFSTGAFAPLSLRPAQVRTALSFQTL